MRKQKIQFIVLAVILIVCIGGYFGITSYYKNKESNEKEASTIKVLEIENYKDLTKVSYNYEDATINLVKKDNKWKDESDTSKNPDSNNINSETTKIVINTPPAITNALDAFSIFYLPIYCTLELETEANELDILVSPINTNGIIKYATNKETIGAKPITFPIKPFLLISFSFEAFLFSL